MSTRAADTQVVFTADTATFDAKVSRSGEVAEQAGIKIERASERVRNAWARETASANSAAESRSAKARADELAALKADILARAEEQAAQRASLVENSLKSFGSTARTAADAVERVGVAHQHAVPQMAAASAAVRTLEGNINTNIRAAERFLTTTLGLGEVLSKLFPVAGALALGAAIFELGKKAYDAYENIVNLQGALRSVNEMEIDVAKKVTAASDKTEAALESILSRTAGKPASLAHKFDAQGQKPLDLSDFFYDEKYKKLPDDIKTDYEKLYKFVAPADAPKAIRNITKEVNDLQRALDLSSQSAFTTVTSVRGFGPDALRTPKEYWAVRLKAAQEIQSLLQASSTQRTSEMQQTQFDISDAEKQDAEKKSQGALEAARRAQELQRKLWAEQHADWELEAQRSAEDEALWWESRTFEAQRGSQNYIEAETKAVDAIRQIRRETAQKDKENQRLEAEILQEQEKVMRQARDRGLEAGGREASGYVQALREKIGADRDGVFAHRDAVIQLQVATGQMSRSDAVRRQAELHADIYSSRRDELQSQRDAVNETPMSITERQRRLAELDVIESKLDSSRRVEVMRDQAAQAATAWKSALSEAMDQFDQRAADSATQARQVFESAVGGFNQQITRLAVGGGTNFSAFARGIGQQGMNIALERAESAIFGAGRPDGSRANPLNVRMVDMPAPSSTLSNAVDAARSVGGGSTIASIASSFFGGGRATGGPVSANMSYLLGEEGPELLTLGSAGGYVSNARQTRTMLGSYGAPRISIDARGAEDPAQVEFRVHRAMEQYMPHIMTGSVAAMHDEKRRNPLSKR